MALIDNLEQRLSSLFGGGGAAGPSFNQQPFTGGVGGVGRDRRDRRRDRGIGGVGGAASLSPAEQANVFAQQGIQGLDPFRSAGVEQLGALTGQFGDIAGQIGDLQQGSTIGGFGDRLRELLGGGALDPLIEDRTRAVQGQLSAGGLTRSGGALESIANIPTELALTIENLLSGRQAGAIGQSLGLAGQRQGVAGLGLGAAGTQAGLFQHQGENILGESISDREARASRGSQFAQIAASIFLSDERLKTNVKYIAEIGGLKVANWDWIPEAEGTIVVNYPRVGFMAQDVEAVYPHLVHEIVGGWKVVNYGQLLVELEAA